MKKQKQPVKGDDNTTKKYFHRLTLTCRFIFTVGDGFPPPP